MSIKKYDKKNKDQMAPEEISHNLWLQLDPAVIQDFKKSGISQEYQAKIGAWNLTQDDAEKLLGFRPENESTMYAIPYPDGYTRVKVLGEKYLSPNKETESEAFHLYYLRECQDLLKKRCPVIICEGEKKAVVTQQFLDGEWHKALAVGIAGVTMWRGTFAKQSPTSFHFSGRQFYIAFDAKDIYDKNEDVQREAFCLWLELYRRKCASASFLYWDSSAGKGIDDYLQGKAIAESPMESLINSASHNPWEFLTLLVEGISGLPLCIKCFAKSHLEKEMVKQIFLEYHLENLYFITFKDFYAKVVKNFEQADATASAEKKPFTEVLEAVERGQKKYIVAKEGVFLELVEDVFGREIITYSRICIDPILFVAKITDIITGETYAKLSLNSQDYVVPITALSGKDLTVLTALGFSIQKPNANDIGEYFLACIDKYVATKKTNEKYASRQGWRTSDCTEFILGNKIITQESVETMTVSPIKESPNFCRKGDIQKWQVEIIKWTDDPQVQFAVGAAIASPLLLPLCIEGKTIHFWGDSSTGKSTITQIAASIWGKVFGENTIISNWLASRCGTESLFNTFNNVPVFLEDSQFAENEYIFQNIMLYANGNGRPRSTLKITIAKQSSWNGHCISTGERATSDVSNYGGCTARSIELLRKKYKQYSAAEFSQLKLTIKNNYGFGEEVIRYWFAHHDEIIAKYQNILSALEKHFSAGDDTKKSRVLPNLAIICVGAWIGEQLFGFFYNWDALVDEIIKLMNSKPTSGSEKLYEELCSLQQCFPERIGYMIGKEYGQDKIQYRYNGGVSGDIVKNELAIYHPGINALCFHPVQLETYLTSRGYSLSQLTGILEEAGKLIVENGRKQYKICINGKYVRVYAIKLPTEIITSDNIFQKTYGQ